MYARIGRCYKVNNSTAITDNTIFLNPYNPKNTMLFNSCNKEQINNYSVQYDLEGHISYIPENINKCEKNINTNDFEYTYNKDEKPFYNFENKIDNNLERIRKIHYQQHEQEQQQQLENQQQQRQNRFIISRNQ